MYSCFSDRAFDFARNNSDDPYSTSALNPQQMIIKFHYSTCSIKDVAFGWEEAHEKAFQVLIRAIETETLLEESRRALPTFFFVCLPAGSAGVSRPVSPCKYRKNYDCIFMFMYMLWCDVTKPCVLITRVPFSLVWCGCTCVVLLVHYLCMPRTLFPPVCGLLSPAGAAIPAGAPPSRFLRLVRP